MSQLAFPLESPFAGRARHSEPSRFTVTVHGKGKNATHEVFCVICGERLVVGEGTDSTKGVELAEENSVRHDCRPAPQVNVETGSYL